MSDVFVEFALIFTLVFFIALIFHKLNQPVLISYLITGFLVGPFVFNLIEDLTYYNLLSHMGISFLLFLVGIQLNITLIKEVGKPSLLTGVGQIFFTFILSILLLLFFNLSNIATILIAISLCFSSTVIIVKLLADKHALETVYGKISIGFLLVQDLIAAFVLIFFSSYASFAKGSSFEMTFISLVCIIASSYLFFIIPKKLGKHLDSFPSELKFLFAIFWCFGIAAFYSYLGFSIEVGALVAGASIASTRFADHVIPKFEALKDFFLVLFFIVLGAELFASSEAILAAQGFLEKISLISSSIGELLPIAILGSLVVLIGNPIIVFIILSRMGYTAREAFFSGLAVSQISEFSLILAALVYQEGLVSSVIVSLLTLIMMITIIFSTYLFHHAEIIYHKFQEPLIRLNHMLNKKRHIP